LADSDSPQIFQVLSAEIGVAPDAFQDVGVEDLCGVKWNRGPLAGGVL
jgi:hypothetical protein